MTSQRIAFLDVDGTLIDHGERIAPSTIEAVRTARANGHLVYLCTGRAATEIYPVIRDIGFDGAVSAGGGFAAIGDELVISRTMPAASTRRMTAAYEALGLEYYVQTVDDVFASPGVLDLFLHYLRMDPAASAPDAPPLEEHPAVQQFSRRRPIPVEGVAKALFLGTDQTAFARVRDALQDEFHVITGTIPHLGGGSGEVSLLGVNKGSTIEQLLPMLGLTPADAIGIGDSSNDVEMLEVCGVGIAMGNAVDAVKARADEVTTSVLDDGVWNAFGRHGLI